MSQYPLDPNAVLDFEWDWSGWLKTGETINGATVTAEPGVTLAPTGRPTVTEATKVTAWLTGGTAGRRYAVTCSITTTAGRSDDRTIVVASMQR